MSVKKVLLATAIALLAIVIFLTWTIWNDGRWGWGWAYVIEVGATVLLLALIWPWLQNRQSTPPPP